MKKSSNYAGEMVTLHLAGKATGERLRIIREKLEEMYPGEYSIKKVAEQCGLTYHGLRKLESGESEPRKSTVRVLADFYNVPLSNIYSEQSPGVFEIDCTFFLGKKEDMLPYFDDYIAAWGQPHFLDPRREFPPEFGEPSILEIEYDDNGIPSLDDISIEVNIKIFQNKTNALVMEKPINSRAPVSKDDVDALQELIRQQIKLVSDYCKRLKQATGEQEQTNN